MVENLSREIIANKGLVGRHLLNVITSGMYNNPLMIIREYIQNAADAIDEADNLGILRRADSYIKINLDGNSRTISIEDSGVGVESKRAVDVLCSFGCSDKKHASNRGFRGIGRLGGLGYCKTLIFETKSIHDDKISIIKWDARSFIDYADKKGAFRENDIFEDIIDISFVKADKNMPRHYFKVTLVGVSAFHDDSLMNLPLMNKYLSQVAPIGYDHSCFAFGNELDKYFSNLKGYNQYNVFLNNEQLYRPYKNKFSLSKDNEDEIKSIVKFDISGHNGECIGRGWYAITNLLSSIPENTTMRGIRVKQGNIEIGNEHFLDRAFVERRFANWHIGEIHLDLKLKTNARRDGFEQTAEYEKFLEQVNVLGRHLSSLCRRFSDKRSLIVNADSTIIRVESFLSSTSYLTEEIVLRKAQSHKKSINNLIVKLNKSNILSHYEERLRKLEKHLDEFLIIPPKCIGNYIDGRKLMNISSRDLLINICEKISNIRGEKESRDILMEIMSPYVKTSVMDE